MRFRIVKGEKSKSCIVVMTGASFYLIESVFEEAGRSVVWGLGLLLAIHAAVIFARFGPMAREPEGGKSDGLVRTIVLATLLAGFVAVAWIYASGRAFQMNWQSYVNALVIGGLSAIFHLVPLDKFKKRRAAGREPNGFRGPAQKL